MGWEVKFEPSTHPIDVQPLEDSDKGRARILIELFVDLDPKNYDPKKKYPDGTVGLSANDMAQMEAQFIREDAALVAELLDHAEDAKVTITTAPVTAGRG